MPKLDQTTEYLTFRGKCKELSEQACNDDSSLRLVRGFYHCPIWGKQQHWWAARADGTIADLTARQFPSKGTGDYEEYDGRIDCEYCGKVVAEDQAYMVEHHAYCSDVCYGHDIGF